MKTLNSILVCVALVVLGAASANAQSLIGSEYGGQTVFAIDGATGTASVVGGNATSRLPGLAYNPNTDTLYGTDEASLYTVDPVDGSAALVGSHGAQSVTALTFDSSYSVLYSVGYNGTLYSINPATGAQTAIGPLGASPNTLLALATNSAGAVYGAGTAGTLYSVNTTTGAATSLGPLTGTSGGVTALAFAADDTLFAIDTGTDRLLTIDVATRVATAVGTDSIGSDVRGLAVVDLPGAAVQAVPALGVPGLMALCLLLGLAGLVRVRHRR